MNSVVIDLALAAWYATIAKDFNESRPCPDAYDALASVSPPSSAMTARLITFPSNAWSRARFHMS
jgi:hypothetical protein